MGGWRGSPYPIRRNAVDGWADGIGICLGSHRSIVRRPWFNLRGGSRRHKSIIAGIRHVRVLTMSGCADYKCNGQKVFDKCTHGLNESLCVVITSDNLSQINQEVMLDWSGRKFGLGAWLMQWLDADSEIGSKAFSARGRCGHHMGRSQLDRFSSAYRLLSL